MGVGTLVLLRHGESEWNAKNLFTGWVDVALSDTGRAEAERGGVLRYVDQYPLPAFVARAGALARAYGDRFTPPRSLLVRA